MLNEYQEVKVEAFSDEEEILRDDEMICLAFIHRIVEVLDRYFGNVCELDVIFNYSDIK